MPASAPRCILYTSETDEENARMHGTPDYEHCPHPAFPNSRTVASYRVQSTDDVPGAVELFRIDYERALAHANLAATRKETP